MSAQVKTALDKALDYAKQAEDTAFQRAKGTAESNAEALAKQLYTQKMVQQKTIGNVMQNAGLSTQGYSETTANAIGSNYQNNWNQAMMQKNDQIAGAQSQKDIAIANLQSKYQTDLANYYASLPQPSNNTNNTKKADPKKDDPKDTPKESLDIVTKNAGMYSANGKVDQKGLTDYLNAMIANGSITPAQADALWDKIVNNKGTPAKTNTPVTYSPTKPGVAGGSSSKDKNEQAIW